MAAVIGETLRNLYDGMSAEEFALAPIMAARSLIEAEPDYAYVSARLYSTSCAPNPHVRSRNTTKRVRVTCASVHRVLPGVRAARGQLNCLTRTAPIRSATSRRSAEAEPTLQFQFLGLQTL